MKKSILIAALFAAAFTGPVAALSVGPLAKIYTANEKTGEIVITNTTTSQESYQIKVDRITVLDGKAVRTPSDAIKFAPMVVTLAPGKSQVVRFLRQSTLAGGEEYYRIVVRQRPKPDAKEWQQLKSMDFPWIWRSPLATPNLKVRWEKDEFVVTNSGSATAQLVGLKSGTKAVEGLVGYVSPGETRGFKLVGFPHGAVTVHVNGKQQVLGAQ